MTEAIAQTESEENQSFITLPILDSRGFRTALSLTTRQHGLLDKQILTATVHENRYNVREEVDQDGKGGIITTVYIAKLGDPRMLVVTNHMKDQYTAESLIANLTNGANNYARVRFATENPLQDASGKRVYSWHAEVAGSEEALEEIKTRLRIAEAMIITASDARRARTSDLEKDDSAIGRYENDDYAPLEIA